jgi:predicted nucleic acid-binding protein
MVAWLLQCVTDTNIWIDLHRGDIIEKAFELQIELIAPDVVINELHNPGGEQLVGLGLQKRELSGPQVQMVLDIAERYAQPSRTDLFALILAREMNAVLLTGDSSLRNAAENEGIGVHGTLWLLDQMVEHSIINKKERAVSLRRMVAYGCRFPIEEVKARLG